MIWFYEVVKSYIFPKNAFQSDPLQTLKDEKHYWPQLFLYSKADDLIPHTVSFNYLKKKKTIFC